MSSLAHKLGMVPNVQVFMLLDMCRTTVERKSNSPYITEPRKGSVFIGFATKASQTAIAINNGVSMYTQDFIKLVKEKKNTILP